MSSNGNITGILRHLGNRDSAASTAPRPHKDGVLCTYKSTARCTVCMYRQAAKTLLGLPKFRCCAVQAAELRARSLSPLHCFAFRARCATALAHGRLLPALSAASHSATNVKPDVQANLRQALELGVQLPELCSGCGVRLQAETPDAPGCVQELFDLHHKAAAFTCTMRMTSVMQILPGLSALAEAASKPPS